MYGDHFGSPGRDDRQDGSEQYDAEWNTRVPDHQSPSDDVKVAGAPVEPPAHQDTGNATTAMPAAGAAETFESGPAETRHDLGAVPPPGPGPRYDAAPGHAAAPRYDAETAVAGVAETFESGPAETRHDLGAVPPPGPGPRYDAASGHAAGTRYDAETAVVGDEFSDMRRTPRASAGLPKIGVIAAAAIVVLGGGTAGAMALTGGSGPAKKSTGTSSQRPQADAAAPTPLTDAQRKQIDGQRRTELKQKALRAARDENVRPMLFAKGAPPPSPKPSDPVGGSAGNPVPAGEAQKIAKSLLSSFGFNPSTQFGCLVNMWNRESGWRVHAANPSGAYGIPQAFPGSKMASAGPDWQNNATTQIKWGLGYIKGRYGTPCQAWAYWQAHGSY